MSKKAKRVFSKEDRLKAERLKRLIDPAEKDIREGRITPIRMFLKEFKTNRFLTIYVFISVLLLGVQSVVCSNPACSGPRHFQKKTKMCVYDVEYPELSNAEMECKVRNWIDLQMKDFDEGPELDPEENKPNEFWVVCERFQSHGLESVYVSNYQYGQGAHGTTDIRTATYDVKTGEEFEISDVIDMGKDWYGAITPYVEEKMNEEGSQVIISREKAMSGIFQHFVINENVLEVIFEEYDAGPHSAGNPRLWIPLYEIKRVLKPTFVSRYLPKKSPEAKSTVAPGKRLKSLDPLFP